MKGRTDQRKLDEKKQERLKYERRLQSNLEHYVTRAVNELTYAVRRRAARDERRARRGRQPDVRIEPRAVAHPAAGAGDEPAPAALVLVRAHLAAERREDVQALRARLPLVPPVCVPVHVSLVATRARARFRPPDSEGEQHYLRALQVLPARLGGRAVVPAQARYRRSTSRCSRCARSRATRTSSSSTTRTCSATPSSAASSTCARLAPVHAAFKRILYQGRSCRCSRAPTVSPSSVQVLRHQLFLDEAAEDEAAGADVADTLQMLPPNTKSAAKTAAAADEAAPARPPTQPRRPRPAVGRLRGRRERGRQARRRARRRRPAPPRPAGGRRRRRAASRSAATSAPDECAPWETTSFAAGESPVTIYLGGRGPALPAEAARGARRTRSRARRRAASTRPR